MKIPEKIEFKVTDLVPLFAVWNEQNKNLVRCALALGFMCGALVGYVTGIAAWGQPLYYAWYYGISGEAYTLILALRVVEKRHHREVNFWLLPWLRMSYWLFFFLVVEGAILLLEKINSGISWIPVLESTKIPNGIAYASTSNAILIGIIAAFPSKIILHVLLSLFNIKLPFPFSEFAEATIGGFTDPILTPSIEEEENSPK